MPKVKDKKKNKTVNKPIEKKGIFNYEEEAKPSRKKLTRTENIKKTNKEEHFIGTKETKPISKKKINRIKKEKVKERRTKDKEIRKIQKEQEKVNKKRAKRSKEARQTEEEIKKKAKIKFLLKISFLVISILGLLIFFLLSPIFNIKNIVVEKNNQISSEQIISLSNIQKDTNMFKVSSKETEKLIKENPYIKNIKIRRNLPDTIKIIVTERTASCMLEYGSSYAYIDNQGYILEISASPKEGLSKIKGYETKEEEIEKGNRLCASDLKKLNMVIKIISSAKSNKIDNLITTINIENDNNYELYLESEGKTAYLGDCTSLDTRMLYLKVILEKEKDHEGEIIIDMDLNEKYPFFREKV